MKRCKRCGNPLNDEDRFCGVCGEPQESGAVRGQKPPQEPKRHPRRRRLVIAVAAVVLLAILGVAAYQLDVIGRVQTLFSSSNDSGVEQAENTTYEASSEDDSSDDDTFVLMEEGCTSRLVTDETSARAALADLADDLGIEDVSSELADCTEGTALEINYWRFNQYYEGLQVLGRSVAVGADEDGQVVAITSTYYPIGDVSVEPEITADEAEEAAEAYLNGATWSFAASNAVYVDDAANACLVWLVYTGSDESAELVYVNAATGEVVASESYLDTGAAVGTGTDIVTGETVSFNIWQDDNDRYRLFDSERNINAYDMDGDTLVIHKDEQGSVTYDTSEFFGSADAVTSNTTTFDNTKAVTAYVSVQAIYDFYANVLGRTGFDNASGTVDLFINDGNTASASSQVEGTTMILRVGEAFGITTDVIAHEYSHGVARTICTFGNTGESRTLSEALADVMAELTEDYANDGQLNGNCNWIITGARNLAEPSLSEEEGAHPSAYKDENWGDPSSDEDKGYIHNNSTVISHAIYLMCTDEGDLLGTALSTEDMARLVYGTMHLLVDNANFSQFRACMELAGRIMASERMLDNDQLVRIAAAFDAVNIDAAWTISSVKNNDVSPDEAASAITAVQDKIDIVLVLDTSDSMSGEPIQAMREAASSFVQTVSSDNIRVGLVSYETTSTVLSPLTTNLSSLSYAIEQLKATGSTNMDAGLQDAVRLLSTDDDRTRIIVLMSDGKPNQGRVDDELIAYADELKEDGIHIYTLCFNSGAEEQALLTAMADECCDYSALENDELEGFFTDIADFILGERFNYVSFACPVDVEVTLGDETLSSSEDNLCTRTSFGTLSVRESEEGDGTTKVLRLHEGEDYEIEITGYDTGTMDYTVGFCDEDGVYTDLRTFTDIPVSEAMSAYTTVAQADSTELYVDEDGDGLIDIAWRAEAGEEAEAFDNRVSAWLVAAVALALLALTTILRISRLRRNVLSGRKTA